MLIGVIVLALLVSIVLQLSDTTWVAGIQGIGGPTIGIIGMTIGTTIGATIMSIWWNMQRAVALSVDFVIYR